MRQSNFELLRIISMLFIVCGHMMSQSGALGFDSGNNLLFACLFGQGERIAVNVFLILGCWFMVSSSFRAERVVRLWGQMFFYLIPISMLILLLGLPYEKVNLVRSFLPFFGRPVWFGSAYIALLLLSPFLSKFYNALSPSGGGKFCILLLILICVFCLITPKEMDNWICSILWFSTVYILVSYYKGNDGCLRVNKFLILASGLLVYCALAIGKYWLIRNGASDSGPSNVIEVYLKDLKSLFSLFISFCVFYFFQHTSIKPSNIVNWLAGSAFAVYIVHQHPLLIRFLWNDIVMIPQWMTSNLFALYTIISLLGIYVAVTLIDKLRVKYIEPLFLNMAKIKKLCSKMNGFYSDI